MNRLAKIVKRTMSIVLCVFVLLAVITYFYLKLPQFGAIPEEARLETVKKSKHYQNGQFRNLIEKPTISEGYSILGELWKTLFKKYPRREPSTTIPSVKTNLKTIPVSSNVLIWFGHSSFFLQVDSVKILVDPVFSGKASPLPWSVTAYKGTDKYTGDDMPEIDYMLLSHDHYDHLDYETAKALQPKVKHVICGLGASAHYERWGYSPQQLIEKDWYEKVDVKPDFSIYTDNTHHGTGRGFIQNQSLWLSFLIHSPSMTIYYSGDGGYTERFKLVAQKFPEIDWAIMECGQYDKAWQSVHELPEEVAQATIELHAKNLLPVHHSKFTLGKHPWDEPLKEITRLSQGKAYRLVTPMIGESVNLNDSTQSFQQWWKNIN
ncbi:MBL fold metallo-hydrolase [Cytophagaceae bacterium YF14B1]|uniref:MBL fold metallo-hydrolase n=1 Tax=Xanthocytophaga flava TaxID=3048013 RepID=A0AAE3QIC4_9BACT|nr:MBL fold metallo-hydrolase [Xanthocytophaga flavus]MDJ1479887.1 MBL fold metallo-hydrolase [Xanthocytophaga flavus]